MSKINLVYATDNNYLLGVRVSALSVMALASRPEELVVHVLDCGIKDDSWKEFMKQVPARRHKIDFKSFPELQQYNGSLAPYARLFIPNLLKGEDWCIYADADTLFTGDIFQLESIYDSATAIQGHKEYNFSHKEWYERNNLEISSESYVCSGFIILNLNWMREHDTSRLCMKFLQMHPDAPFADQEALNYILKGNIGFLPDQWGDASSVALGKVPPPGCIHYIMELPWKLRWKWHLGYSDAVAVWVKCAECLADVSQRDSTGIPSWKWHIGRIYNHVIRICASCLKLIPAFSKRFPNFRTRFLNRKHRCFYSYRYWGGNKTVSYER